jgi:predicted PurR-regulated permease PerM
MTIINRVTTSVLVTILLFIAAGAFIYAARHAIIAFIFAILFAYLLDPVVSRVELWTRLSRGSRSIAIFEVYVILCVVISVALIAIGPRVADEIRNLLASLPGLLERVGSGQIVREIGFARGWSYQTQLRLQQFFAARRDMLLSWVPSLGPYAAKFAQNLIWVLLVPILAIFFLKDGRSFADATVRMRLFQPYRRFLETVMEDLNEMLALFIRAQLLLATLSLAGYSIMLGLLHVPFAFALALVGGLLELIPMIGPLVAAIVILGIAFLSNYPHMFVLAALLAGWRLTQDYVNSPRVFGGRLDIHPLLTIFAILAGGEIGGAVGVYLAIPLAATLRILWRRSQERPSGYEIPEPAQIDRTLTG